MDGSIFTSIIKNKIRHFLDHDISPLRVFRRIAFALIFFLIIDITTMRALTGSSTARFERQYRFKEGTNISNIRIYVEHIKARVNNDRRTGKKETVVAFLGSSPTYGHRIKRTGNTYPYAFETRANRLAGRGTAGTGGVTPVKVFNLASNGQLLADQYYIAKELIDSVDAFLVQLNYHTFNPADTNRPKIRYERLPTLLGSTVSVDEAAVLGKKPGIGETIERSLYQVAQQSFIFANRDYITDTLFGGPPEEALFKKFGKITGHTDAAGADIAGIKANSATDKDTMVAKSTSAAGMNITGAKVTNGQDTGIFGESNIPFSELTPQKRMIIIRRCADSYNFTIPAPSDTEPMQVGAIAAKRSKSSTMPTQNNTIQTQNGRIDAMPAQSSTEPLESNNKVMQTGATSAQGSNAPVQIGTKLVQSNIKPAQKGRNSEQASEQDSELFFLDKLAVLLAEHEKPAIFFMTPLNVEALDEYSIIDWPTYDANMLALKARIERHGLRFVDANTATGVVPSEQFFDISHTLDAGGQMCGKWLAGQGEGYLWRRP